MSKKIKMQWRTMLEWNTSGRVVKKGEKEFKKNNKENSKHQNKPKSSNIGEYIDYEEID